jgi:hypothetical protein
MKAPSVAPITASQVFAETVGAALEFVDARRAVGIVSTVVDIVVMILSSSSPAQEDALNSFVR